MRPLGLFPKGNPSADDLTRTLTQDTPNTHDFYFKIFFAAIYFALKREVESLKIPIGESMAIVNGILSRVDM
jgi:hypothetical protein